MNTLTMSGLYFCSNCTDRPPVTTYTTWCVQVISNGSSLRQVAIAWASADEVRWERSYSAITSTWSDWLETHMSVRARGNLSTQQSFRKAGQADYGSFIILGTVGGVGGVCIACNVSNSAISTKINLYTGSAWSNANFTIDYNVDSESVGWIKLKTTSSLLSALTIFMG